MQTLKVKDLIAKLQTMPQDLRVVLDGYEGGVGGITESAVKQTKIYLNVNSHEAKDAVAHNAYWDYTLTEAQAELARQVIMQEEVVLISRVSEEDFEQDGVFGLHEVIAD